MNRRNILQIALKMIFVVIFNISFLLFQEFIILYQCGLHMVLSIFPMLHFYLHQNCWERSLSYLNWG